MNLDARVDRLDQLTDALLGLVRELAAVIPDLGVKPSAASRLDAISRRAEHLRSELHGRR